MQRRRFVWSAGIGLDAFALPRAAAAAPTWRSRALDVDQARAGLKASIAQSAGGGGDAYVRVAQWHLWAGLLEAERGASDDALKKLYAAGLAAAQRTQTLSPGEPGGYFFEAVHRAKIAEIRGVVASVFELPTLNSLMDKTDALAPGYGYFGTARFWGAVAAKTPSFLLRMKGSSLEEGDAYFRRAIAGRPDFAGNHVLRAPLLRRLMGDAQARASLTRARKTPTAASAGVEAWNRYYRRQAARQLRSWG